MSRASCSPGCGRSGRRPTTRAGGAWQRCCRSGSRPTRPTSASCRPRRGTSFWRSARERWTGCWSHCESKGWVVRRRGRARRCGTRFRFAAACGRKTRRGGWKSTRWRCAGAAWPGNLSGCSTGWITRRPGGNACALGAGPGGTLAALQDIEACLPFSLLGLDSDNGGEFLNYHVMKWLQQRPRPVFMTRS